MVHTYIMKTYEAMTIIWSDRFVEHATGSHPERPERITALREALEAARVFERDRILEPVAAPLEAVERVHDPRMINLIRDLAESGGGWLDPDTVVSPASFEIALLAAGAAITGLTAAVDGSPSFALVRPPGHHAEPARAMGFCLFNNVAIAVNRVREVGGIDRVAILDWDVHHGNGTQAIFWDDPNVLFISLHQYPFYPGTGAASERGGGDGEGTTVNVPLAAGGGDAEYRQAFDDEVLPSIRAFEPELLVVSAGFDAHRDDPLASMRVTTDGFGWMAREVVKLALEVADGRLAFVLEGGYNLQSLGESTVAVLDEIRRGYEIGETQ